MLNTQTNEIIMASAGSGKTHALTTRYLRLLAEGEAPEGIIALTFSRASGAEFFTKILSRLGKGAGSEAGAAFLAKQLELPELGQGEFMVLLEKVVSNWHRLPLGTMDGFFARITQAFPFELGLQGGFEVLDKFAQTQERRAVYKRMFQAVAELTPDQKNFLGAFQQTTFGQEERSLLTLLDKFVLGFVDYYLSAPEGEKWGQAKQIWSKMPAFMKEKNSFLETWVAADSEVGILTDPKLKKLLREFLELWQGYEIGKPIPTGQAKLQEDITAAVTAFSKKKPAKFTYRKAEFEIPDAVCQMLLSMRFIVERDLWLVRLERTRGLFSVLQQYDKEYHSQVRMGGKLTFQDVQRLIVQDFPESDEVSEDTPAFDKDQLFFRMDGKLNHWLLDEFQDTSGLQWRILDPLITEVLQETGPGRSFFAVGDVKQAIYGWRGGQARLFSHLTQSYPLEDGHGIQLSSLTRSWRSAPPILQLVNDLFGDEQKLRVQLNLRSLGNWSFEPHASVHQDLTGCAEVLAVMKPKKAKKESGAEEDDKQDPVWMVLKERLEILRPLERGLSCGVLVMTNAQAVEVASFIGAELGMKATTKSMAKITTDNSITVALLDLIRGAAHPTDTKAQKHVRLKPLAERLRLRLKVEKLEFLERRVLQDLHIQGFSETLRKWLSLLDDSQNPLDTFSRHRWLQLIGIARDYEARYPGRDIDGFLAFAAEQEIAIPGSDAAIQVQTWNKSKGLEYDIVFVLGSDHSIHATNKAEFAAYIDLETTNIAKPEVKWLTYLPPRKFAEKDPTIHRWLEQDNVLRWEDNLCKLYVALTRAKRHTCVIFPDSDSESENARLDRLMDGILSQPESDSYDVDGNKVRYVYRNGEPQWYEQHPLQKPKRDIQEEATAPVEPELFGNHWFANLAPGQNTGLAEVPSAKVSRAFKTRYGFFLPGNEDTAHLGAAIHAMLEQLHWDTSPEYLVKINLPPQFSGATKHEVRGIVRDFLADKNHRSYFTAADHPPHTQLWQEEPFQVKLGEKELRGVFDRVLIYRPTPEGPPSKAILIDFKLSSNPQSAKTHLNQLEQYQRALSALLGLPLEAVETVILSIF